MEAYIEEYRPATRSCRPLIRQHQARLGREADGDLLARLWRRKLRVIELIELEGLLRQAHADAHGRPQEHHVVDRAAQVIDRAGRIVPLSESTSGRSATVIGLASSAHR